MYNLRYHIASLVAVFVALAVGLLLGSIVSEAGVISSQRTALVSGLQAEFDALRSEAKTLSATNDTLSAFTSEAVPGIVSGVLADRTVIVIASPDDADTAARASEAIRLAGGNVALATFTGPRFSLDDESVAAAVAKDLGVTAASIDTTQVMDALAAEWSTGGSSRPVTKVLIASGGLKLEGLAATATVSGTAVTAVYDGTPDPWAIRLAGALTNSARFAVGVDTRTHVGGSAQAAKTAGLSGVDDVDTPLGQVAFAWVLSGRTSGLFGEADGATARYPSPLFAK
jgi:hypothetical protein